MRPYCPFKMAKERTIDWYCEEQDCALWEEYTEMCSIKAIAFLQAIGAERTGERLPFSLRRYDVTGSPEPITTIDIKEGNDD